MKIVLYLTSLNLLLQSVPCFAETWADGSTNCGSWQPGIYYYSQREHLRLNGNHILPYDKSGVFLIVPDRAAYRRETVWNVRLFTKAKQEKTTEVLRISRNAVDTECRQENIRRIVPLSQKYDDDSTFRRFENFKLDSSRLADDALNTWHFNAGKSVRGGCYNTKRSVSSFLSNGKVWVQARAVKKYGGNVAFAADKTNSPDETKLELPFADVTSALVFKKSDAPVCQTLPVPHSRSWFFGWTPQTTKIEIQRLPSKAIYKTFFIDWD